MSNLSKKIADALEKGGLKCIEKRMIKPRGCNDVTEFLKKKKEFEENARLDMVFGPLKSDYQNQAYCN